jgi:hypothetical protein
MSASFDFSTKAYLKAYFMDSDRLKEFRQQNLDPLAGLGDRQPVAVYTSGPVRISMGFGTQPIGIAAGEALPTWSVAVENLWEGNILGITSIFFMTPQGITLNELGGVPVREVGCGQLPTEDERAVCDDSLVNVYALPSEELAQQKYQNQTVILFRAHTSVTDVNAALGQAPVAVQNFKVSVSYTYQIQRTIPLVIAVPAQ